MLRPAAPDLVLNPLTSMSPSRFSEAERCGLRAAWAAARNPELLPGNPARRLGTVVHRLLEEAERGQLAGQTEITSRFGALEATEDAQMRHSWLERRFAPLANSVADYADRRQIALETAAELAAAAPAGPAAAGAGRRRSGAEVTLIARGGKVTGRADRILETGSGVVVQDAKTGSIFEPAPDGSRQVKSDYATQLRLYAAIYAEDTEISFGSWPSRLELLQPGGSPVPVAFSPPQCTELLDRAEATLETLNTVITTPASRTTRELLLARPSAEACGWCPYRPACRGYLAAASGRGDRKAWPRDVWGTVADIRQVGNGTVSLTINADGQPVRVRGLTPDPQRHPVLPQLELGGTAAIFGLVAQGGANTQGEGPRTVIYSAS